MKPGIPWSVKGIEPEVREVAKHAARRSGMTLGEWLNSVILDQAEDSASPQQLVASPDQKEFSDMTPDVQTRARSETTIRLEDIALQLSALAKREQDSAAIRPYEAPAARHADQDMMNRILGRIEQNERQSVEAFIAMNERFAALGRQLSQAAPAKVIEKPEDVPGFQALEGALRNIVDHIEISERRTRDSLKTMQDRMAEMTLRANHASGDDLLRTAPAFASLEARLGELAVRVQRNEASLEVGFNDAIKREVGQLAARIDNTHRHAEQLAASAQAAATQTAQAELRGIEGRIQTLLRETQSTMASQQVGQGDVHKLRSEIGQLTQRIDDVRGGAASARDVHALQTAVEQLSTRMAQGPDLRPLAEMDKRLADITQRLEYDRSNPRHLSQLGELEQRIAELDHRLADVIRMQGDGQAMQALETHLTDVNGRLANAEQHLGHLDTIERAITQLFDGLEQHRTETGQAIDEAARRTAQGQPSLKASPELLALEQGLRAVRESADQSDRRSQETLEAVHETLEQIVTKLAELETSAAWKTVSSKIGSAV
jgi:localization factor PodJL